MNQEIFTVGQLAERWGVPLSSIRRMIKRQFSLLTGKAPPRPRYARRSGARCRRSTGRILMA